jgi:hypothetical protein
MEMTDGRKTRLAYGALLCALFCNIVCGKEPDLTSRKKETPEQRAERMQWWNSARFGMFVHWGVYSVTGGEFRGHMPTNSAEWMMNKARISIADYKTENVDKFNPAKFDAQAFVKLPEQQESVEVQSTGSYYNYVKKLLGTIQIDQAGKYSLSIKPEKDGWKPINLRQLELHRQ